MALLEVCQEHGVAHSVLMLGLTCNSWVLPKFDPCFYTEERITMTFILKMYIPVFGVYLVRFYIDL